MHKQLYGKLPQQERTCLGAERTWGHKAKRQRAVGANAKRVTDLNGMRPRKASNSDRLWNVTSSCGRARARERLKH